MSEEDSAVESIRSLFAAVSFSRAEKENPHANNLYCTSTFPGSLRLLHVDVFYSESIVYVYPHLATRVLCIVRVERSRLVKILVCIGGWQVN